MRNSQEYTRRALIAGAAASVATPALAAPSDGASEGFAQVSWTPKMRQVAKVEPCP